MNATMIERWPVRARAGRMLIALILVCGLVIPSSLVRAQDESEEQDRVLLAEVPSTGAARPGPISLVEAAGEATPEGEEADVAVVPEGVAPIAFQIDRFGVDAAVEVGLITDDDVMVDPTGPWVITWYEAIASPGQGTNVVVAGHVDYWNVGPAVLWGVWNPGLVEGDIIRLIGEEGQVFEYAVEWSRMYHVATELTPEVIQTEVVGDTGQESLTIITCGGEFNPETGEYLSRVVVRANLI